MLEQPYGRGLGLRVEPDNPSQIEDSAEIARNHATGIELAFFNERDVRPSRSAGSPNFPYESTRSPEAVSKSRSRLARTHRPARRPCAREYLLAAAPARARHRRGTQPNLARSS